MLKVYRKKVPEYFGDCLWDLEIISSDILKSLLRLSLCRRNAENYRENYVFLESGAKAYPMTKKNRQRFLSIFGTAHLN